MDQKTTRPDRHNRAPPSGWVTRFMSGCSPDKPVADIACGSGRHTRLALDAGLTVIAIDRDTSMLTDLKDHPALTTIQADMETGTEPFPIKPASVGGIIVANYLHRPILQDIVCALTPDGVLIYETFAVGNERFGRPSNPDFLLQPGELLAAITGTLTPMAFEHTRLNDPARLVQRIAAVGPDHKWLSSPPAA